ncbi:hypothetical protein RN51_01655 [Microbacterium oxydans]|uniref:Secreted protein n=1 Tax=Microbacterium oxydans TaxID=82380 RepID=A0A0F0KS13_9MICO|nr:hypothetical protein [Microbacterium oxydans]KJL22910.1 hypothetical protein RN51_01655 [Microbacterium oxydans]
MKRITHIAVTAVTLFALATGVGITAAHAATPERILPAGSQAQAANIAPMAIPSGSCIRHQSATMTTLFVRPGVAVTRAQMANHMDGSAAQVADSTWPQEPAPANRVRRNGEAWVGQQGDWAAIGTSARTGLNFHVVIATWTNALPC